MGIAWRNQSGDQTPPKPGQENDATESIEHKQLQLVGQRGTTKKKMRKSSSVKTVGVPEAKKKQGGGAKKTWPNLWETFSTNTVENQRRVKKTSANTPGMGTGGRAELGLKAGQKLKGRTTASACPEKSGGRGTEKTRMGGLRKKRGNLKRGLPRGPSNRGWCKRPS